VVTTSDPSHRRSGVDRSEPPVVLDVRTPTGSREAEVRRRTTARPEKPEDGTKDIAASRRYLTETAALSEPVRRDRGRSLHPTWSDLDLDAWVRAQAQLDPDVVNWFRSWETTNRWRDHVARLTCSGLLLTADHGTVTPAAATEATALWTSLIVTQIRGAGPKSTTVWRTRLDLEKRSAVVIVAGGQCPLQVRQPSVDGLGVEATTAVFDSDVDTHGDHQPVVGLQLVPAVPGDTVVEESVVVSPQEGLLESSSVGDGPIENGRVDHVVDPEPGGQAPIEGLPVDQVDGPVAVVRDEDVGAPGVSVDDREASRLDGAVDHDGGVSREELLDEVGPVSNELASAVFEYVRDAGRSDVDEPLNCAASGIG
jgi:hypothetical protein